MRTPAPSRRSLALLLVALAAAVPAAARAAEFNFGGRIQSDVRFRIQRKSIGEYYNELVLPVGIERNRNAIKLKLTAAAGAFTGVAELDFVWLGYAGGIEGISDLSRYDKVSPYYVKPYALYVEAKDLGVEGLDLRIGQQLVLWGVGDQFNATNNLNATDLEDPLLFGEQQANLMAKLDYSFKERWTISGVLVPIFKPALLPSSGPLALAATDRVPFTAGPLRWRIHSETTLTSRVFGELGAKGLSFPTAVTRVTPVLPETSLGNMQWALRVAGVLADQDVALSYYNGRTDFPVAFLNYAKLNRRAICNPQNAAQCVDGTIDTEVSLAYPRVQVVGLNLSGQINPLKWITKRVKPLGYRFELGLYFPQEATMAILNEPLNFGPLSQPGGEYDYANTKGWNVSDPRRPTTVRSTPFAKWVLGLDYTFSRFVYANMQWVHGLADEFGAGDWITEGWAVRQGGVTSTPLDTVKCAQAKDGEKCARELLHPRLGDYLAMVVDVKLREDRLLLRLFAMFDMSGIFEEQWDAAQQKRVRRHRNMFTADGFSAVIYPELVYNFQNGLELGAGMLLELGKSHTKFGDPAAGGSLAWTRARYSY